MNEESDNEIVAVCEGCDTNILNYEGYLFTKEGVCLCADCALVYLEETKGE